MPSDGSAGPVLVLAPAGRDAEAAVRVLAKHGIPSRITGSLAELAEGVDPSAGAMLITEEALERSDTTPLRAALDAQPPWSDLPTVLLARPRGGPMREDPRRLVPAATSTMTLERPLSTASLVSAVEWALASRRRQRQLRDHLTALEDRTAALRDSEAALRELTATLEARVLAEVGERQQAEARLFQSQKMEAVGQLTGGIAHDFNNLLTGIIGALDLTARRLRDGRTEGVERYMEAARASAMRAASLTHRLLAFSRRQSLDPRPVSLNRLVRSMEDLLRRTLGEGVVLRTGLDPAEPSALADENQLESALLNLAINARDAMPDGGILTVSTGIGPDGMATIAVGDTGTGMTPEVLERAFDPFFTTKPIGQGTGLGLSMIHGFVHQSGGAVRIDSSPGAGTTVTLHLPLVRADDAPDAPAPAPAAQPGQGEAVLLVEDDPAVRMLVLEVLRDLGYRAHAVGRADDALPILRGDVRLDLMVSDVGLPGMNGRDLAAIARRLRPGLPVLFITGYPGGASTRSEFLESGMELVSKPFAIDALSRTIRTMMEERPAPG
ncbi:ATP-binding protein [Roseomonas sp. CCTCC AB2023176]|uniref:ATP-binding protein n=1 Tax=Roseomonas sp. CCTCC AB2023176 TaxID=3342640 RepID=UPI0035D9A2C6